MSRLTETVRDELRAFITNAKANWESTILMIADEYAGMDPDEVDEPIAMQLTISTKDGSTWSYQTGDNSYTGSCYGDPHWAVVYIGPDDIEDQASLREIAGDAIDQLDERLAQSEPEPPNDDACPQCNGPGVFIGRFGDINHFRCRYCGWNFKRLELEKEVDS